MTRPAQMSCLVATLVALPLLLSSDAMAHAFRPALLQLDLDGAIVDVHWKVSTRVGPDGAVAEESAPEAATGPRFPEHCQPVGPVREEVIERDLSLRWRLDCGDDGLVGHAIQVVGLGEAALDVLVRVEFSDGQQTTAVLRAELPSWVIEAPEQVAGLDWSHFFVFGVEHILFGADHLLFVLGLLLLVTGLRSLLVTITAFTIAHSITLAASVTGVLALPTAPAEAVIALSIVFVALEVAKPKSQWIGPTLAQRRPWTVAFAFGLLHGFGFAGALRELGMPQESVVSGLLGFNLGVEGGQLAFVAAAMALFWAFRLIVKDEKRLASLRPLSAYAIGTAGTYWVIVRVVGFW